MFNASDTNTDNLSYKASKSQTKHGGNEVRGYICDLINIVACQLGSTDGSCCR